MINPIDMLREAIKAVPSVKYALGIGGVASIVAIIINLFGLSPTIAIIGTIVVLILMGVLVIFARMTSINSTKMFIPIMSFTWFVLIFFILISLSLFTSIFFRIPLDLHHWISPDSNPQPINNMEILDEFPAYKLHSKMLEINNSKNINNEDLKINPTSLLREFVLNNPWGDTLKNLFTSESDGLGFDIKTYMVGEYILLTLKGYIFFIDIKKNTVVYDDPDMGLGILGVKIIDFNKKTNPNAIVEVEYQTISGTGTYATSTKVYTITGNNILLSLVKPKFEYNSGWGAFKHQYVELRSKNFYQIDPDTLNYQIRTKGFAGMLDTDTDTDTDTVKIPSFSSVRSLPEELYIWDKQSQQFVQKEGRITSGQDLMTSVYSDFADPVKGWFEKPGELQKKDLNENLKVFY